MGLIPRSVRSLKQEIVGRRYKIHLITTLGRRSVFPTFSCSLGENRYQEIIFVSPLGMNCVTNEQS